MSLGVALAILTGLSWVVTGAVVGYSERRGYGTARQQRLGNAYIAAISAAVIAAGMAMRPHSPAYSLRCDAPSAIWTLLCGALNYAMMIAMGRAMLRGPNGTVWTIVQSGFVLPFAMGIALGNTPPAAGGIAGALCVLGGIAAGARSTGAPPVEEARAGRPCSSGRQPSRVATSWFLPALAGFHLCGANQCALALASMGPAQTRPSPLLRILLLCAGTFAAMAAHRVAGAKKEKTPPASPWNFRGVCALYAAVYFLSVFLFQLRALDLLAAAGRISLANPLMLASSLVGFAAYGAIVLRERPSARQTAGLILALAGILLMARG